MTTDETTRQDRTTAMNQASPQDRPTADAVPAGTSPAAAQDLPAARPEQPSGPRTGTIVAGLVLVLLGLGVVAVGAGATLDLQAALIVLLVVAGAALLVGAVLGARRSR